MGEAISADDLYVAFVFSVAIGPRMVAGFSEVSGLAVESEVESLREGGVNEFEHQLVGPTRYASRLVLKRGLGDPQDLWMWYRQVLNGQIARQDVTIYLNGTRSRPGLQWTLTDACPVKWTGPELRASTSAVAFETIEIVHRGVRA
jgi:phage tail-like protein